MATKLVIIVAVSSAGVVLKVVLVRVADGKQESSEK